MRKKKKERINKKEKMKQRKKQKGRKKQRKKENREGIRIFGKTFMLEIYFEI